MCVESVGHGTLVKLDLLRSGFVDMRGSAKLPAPSALTPRLTTLATAVGFRGDLLAAILRRGSIYIQPLEKSPRALFTPKILSFHQGLFILCPFALPLRQISSCIFVMYQRVHSFIHESSSLRENKIAIV